MNNNLIWAITLILIFGIICGTIIYVNSHPFVFRLEMDDNSRIAITSINYSAFNTYDRPYLEEDLEGKE